MSNEKSKAPATAAAPGTIQAPAFDESLIKGFEKVATGAVGFARTEKGDVIFGTILGMHPQLECVLVELAHPAVVHDGKEKEDRKFWLAPKGDVVNVNFYYETAPVLTEPRLLGHKVFIRVGDSEGIGKGRTLIHFDVRLPEGAPRPGLQKRETPELPEGAPNGAASAPTPQVQAQGRF